jgi:hypothetical protein
MNYLKSELLSKSNSRETFYLLTDFNSVQIFPVSLDRNTARCFSTNTGNKLIHLHKWVLVTNFVSGSSYKEN